jgi:hypothetical protein
MDTEGPMYRVLSNSCSGGPCPTLYRKDGVAGVFVQGYLTDERPGPANPDEGFLFIPDEAFETLLRNLPR